MTPANAVRVADQLAHLRGAAMKLGQMVSMDAGDMLPPELAAILARLRDNAHHMPPPQLDTRPTSQFLPEADLENRVPASVVERTTKKLRIRN